MSSAWVESGGHVPAEESSWWPALRQMNSGWVLQAGTRTACIAVAQGGFNAPKWARCGQPEARPRRTQLADALRLSRVSAVLVRVAGLQQRPGGLRVQGTLPMLVLQLRCAVPLRPARRRGAACRVLAVQVSTLDLAGSKQRWRAVRVRTEGSDRPRSSAGPRQPRGDSVRVLGSR